MSIADQRLTEILDFSYQRLGPRVLVQNTLPTSKYIESNLGDHFFEFSIKRVES